MTGVPRPTIAQVITLCIVLPVFYFTYTYFVISDYLAGLCTFIFRRFGRNLGLFFGSYNVKLIVALLVISIAPMAAIIVALFSYEGDRLQVRDRQRRRRQRSWAWRSPPISSPARCCGRSATCRSAMGKVAEGDLSQRVPVTSNDEVGELTGQFNNMVEGLRERERFRETFGRYVDESVAATILQARGRGRAGRRDARGHHPVHRHRGLHHHRRAPRARTTWWRR